MRLAERESFYHELEQTVDAGIPLLQALPIIARGKGAPARTAAYLASFRTEEDLLNGWQHRLGELDAAMMKVGLLSGRLAPVFHFLVQNYAAQAKTRRRILRQAIYPLVVFHLAVLLLSIPLAIQSGGLAYYLALVARGLGALYAALFILFLTGNLLRQAWQRFAFLEQIFWAIPLLGGWLRTAAAARFAACLSMALGSGIGVASSLRLAAQASHSASLIRQVDPATNCLRQQTDLATALQADHLFPGVLEQAIRIGEQTGRLPAELRRAADILQAQVIRNLEVLAEWLPRLIYLGLAGLVAWGIIRTVSNLYQTYDSLLNAM